LAGKIATMEIILKYFPKLTEAQQGQFAMLKPLYEDWNAKVNLISRKDIDHLYEHHVLHSLAIARFLTFTAGSEVLDIGTGGGFPGIPLAILFPDTKFHLVDGTLKKIKVVEEVIQALGLKNARAEQVRVEELKGARYDFVVTRAVADMAQLRNWTYNRFKHKHQNPMPNGLIALKGGRVEQEIKALPKGEYTETCPISDFFEEPYFEEKYIVYLQA
jgi:16S rRNA (guanine527-N7)-methyltransferase